MYRVKTSYRTGIDRPIVEHGPWHAARRDAEYWAEMLRAAGYAVTIENQNINNNASDDDNSDLAAALAGMA